MDRRRFAPALVLYEEKNVVAKLRREGVPVHVLPPLPDWLPPSRGTRMARALVRARELWSVVAPRARALVPVLRREHPDLIYLANGVPANIDALVAAALCRLPVISHEKGLRRIGPPERLMSRWIHTSIGMTKQVTEHVRASGIRPRRQLTIYDGIDCDEFAPGGGAALRREFGIPADASVVGIVGHLQRWKGQLLVVEAVAQARERHPTLRCLIVGGVHRLGADYAAELRERIDALGLADVVTLTGARSDVPACLDAMDVVIHSSVRPEPFGRVMIEAMALRRPIIAPREGGPLEIVVDGETGLLVPPRDTAALAVAIGALVGDVTRRRAMGEAGRKRVESVFDIRHHVRAVESVFDDVLDGRAVVSEPSRAAL
jgi:glycosyltransferase involved in cell wall biosynthesis